MAAATNWSKAIQPLLKKYRGAPHPLEYHNIYQLVVMVVLSAQSTDKIVNDRAAALFKAYPDMAALSRAKTDKLFPLLQGIRNFAHKADWLIKIAKTVRKDSDIPKEMEELVALPGIGRKSANVIRRGAGLPPEGIIVDLHVVRVAARLGISDAEDPKEIERQMMEVLPKKDWDAGMALSFLGREICRPKPLCEICPMNTVCAFYKESKK